MKNICECFYEVRNSFLWYYTTEGEKVYVVPYFFAMDDKVRRVNYCPICGKEVRNATIPEKEF